MAIQKVTLPTDVYRRCQRLFHMQRIPTPEVANRYGLIEKGVTKNANGGLLFQWHLKLLLKAVEAKFIGV